MTGTRIDRIGGRLLWPLLLTLGACAGNRPAPVVPPAADSALARARADSLAAQARRDSLAAAARADSIARVRADSAARALAAARPDSVRAQVQRDGAETEPATPSGLPRAQDSILALPLLFETDRSDLTAEARARLDQKVELLRAHPRLAVQIEGHCDERGSDEYNLALGNRRALTVRRYALERGIAAERLSVISYGEERPVERGANEAAWARNRRAEFRVTRSAR